MRAKKITALVLCLVLILSSLAAFTACSKQKVKENTWQLSLDTSKWNNITVTVTDKLQKEDGGDVEGKTSVSTMKLEGTKIYRSYMSGNDLQESYYEQKDGKWYMIFNSGTSEKPEWVGYHSEYSADPRKSLENFISSDALKFSEAQYDKKEKCYILNNVKLTGEDETVETIKMYFQSDVLEKIEIFYKLEDNEALGAKAREVMIVTLTDRDATTVTVPHYTAFTA